MNTDSMDHNLSKYAELAVRVGVNLQKGQTLVVNAPIQAVELVRKIAKIAYEIGAKNVHVEWNDDDLTALKYKLAPDEAFTEYPMWRAQGMEQWSSTGEGAFLTILSPNPDLLKDIDPKRVATATKTASTALQKHRANSMSYRARWCLISVANEAWAAKVFPSLPLEEAVEQLWAFVFKATRVDLGDPIQAWNDHNDELHRKVNYLNAKQYRKLIYTAPGTNLTIGLPDKHVWLGGSKPAQDEVPFNPNMPTEEVFTMPHKDEIDGVVRSTKPLNYGGTVIDNFSLTFEKGRVTGMTAEQGEETLQHLLDTDEGARRLGEVALVPFHSPISDSNLIFFNTLFDENASNHLALGQAYPTNIEGGTGMSKEELAEHGVNTSLTHVDFMVGSAEMDIDGVTADGRNEPIFRNGNWAF
ncbi:aminopeptidase [Paenibacillus koleovorans]|uniref:aminopeptidase n=1 Tax=Paenibacillus koleovorans TaxID=121608 RepID=UPI000FD7CF6E|nr:aminopeptidase [Paenibacillus koleovorans]